MKRPKRRRSNDNPYYLNNDGEYLIEFKTEKNDIQRVKVSKEVYDAFDRFELDDLKQLNEYDRHLEHSELLDSDLYKRTAFKSKLTDEIVEEITDLNSLKEALNSLSEIQKRRIKMYYFNNLKLREIAKIEHCSIMSVKNSVDNGIKNLEEILKKIPM